MTGQNVRYHFPGVNTDYDSALADIKSTQSWLNAYLSKQCTVLSCKVRDKINPKLLLLDPFTPDSAKFKIDKFSKITNWVKYCSTAFQ